MRVSEWVVAAFFSYTTALVLVLPMPSQMRLRTLAANAIVGLIYAGVLRCRNELWIDYARDWIPQALAILAYKQMGWFAPPVHTYTFEHRWIAWDRLLLDNWHLRSAIEFLGPLLPSLLEISYSLVYTVPPVTVAILYFAGLRRRADTFLTFYLLGLFLSYAQFPFWPSEPPRTVFPGQDLPSIHTVFRDFNLWLVGGYGIHTSVFPSAHVSGVFAAAFALLYLMPRRHLLVLGYFLYAILVAFAVVYGRYHYVVDAIGGFIIAMVALPLGFWLLSLSRGRGKFNNGARPGASGQFITSDDTRS